MLKLRCETDREFYPPRPLESVPRHLFHLYADWYVQVKKEGACNVMKVSPERVVTARDRRRQPHKAWRPNEATHRIFRNLPGRGWYVFEAELMHSKAKALPGQPPLRNINYIHDILVADGDYLLGETLAKRQQRLLDLFQPKATSMHRSHYVLDANTWLAINHTGNHLGLFRSLTEPQDEGIVFKDPDAPLCSCALPNANSHWQRKSRRFSKNHGE